MQQRTGETEVKHYRADRFYSIAGQWFFSSRENLQVGPFASREMAEYELQNFLRHVNEGGIYAEPMANVAHF